MTHDPLLAPVVPPVSLSIFILFWLVPPRITRRSPGLTVR